MKNSDLSYFLNNHNQSLTEVGQLQIPQSIGEDAWQALQNFIDQVIKIH